jgi:class 3 adenylate cyclase
MSLHAVVLVCDLRGFSAWTNQVEAIPAMGPCIEALQAALRVAFSRAWLKGLGDGALLVAEVDRPASSGAVADLLEQVMRKAAQVDLRLAQVCQRLAERYGVPTDLRLGWGVSRGTVYPHDGDYLGRPLNLASRLCALARPSGLVIDAAAFPIAPVHGAAGALSRHVLPVRSHGEALPVWVSASVELCARGTQPGARAEA